MENRDFIPITVDHIARVEGKGGIEIIFSKDGIKEVKLKILEGPRLFESITIGKEIDEALAIYSRICSFCSAAHKLTAVDAVEKAIGYTVSEEIQALRELLYIGDIIESHALHLYLLVLPDYLGFSGPLNRQMLNMYRKELEIALDLKRLGNLIMDEIGSRSIHQENVVVGGFGKIPEEDFFKDLREKLKEALLKAEYTFFLFSRLEQYTEVVSEIVHVALNPRNNKYGVYGDSIKISDGTEFSPAEYKKYFVEKVVSHSFAKQSFIKGVHPFMTGAISRIVINGEKLYGKAKELYNNYRDLFTSENPFANNIAQALELVYFIEKAIDIVDMLMERWPFKSRENVRKTKEGFGVSVTEAPRGVLLYALGVKDGRISYADIITPTAFNLAMMEEHVRMMATAHVKDSPEQLKLLTEMVVRAYDPCISCSVHVVRDNI